MLEGITQWGNCSEEVRPEIEIEINHVVTIISLFTAIGAECHCRELTGPDIGATPQLLII